MEKIPSVLVIALKRFKTFQKKCTIFSSGALYKGKNAPVPLALLRTKHQAYTLFNQDLLVDSFKDVLEAAVVFLQDGVLGAEVKRPLLGQCILEATVSKSFNRL